MSDTTPNLVNLEDDEKVEEAKAEYTAFLESFEKKYGYGIGAVSEPFIAPDGTLRVPTLMKLVKINSSVMDNQNPVSTTPNGDTETEETSPSDSQEQPTA